MKKKIFTLLALFAGVLGAYADNTLSVKDVDLLKGGTGYVYIELDNETNYCAYQMSLVLPKGVTVNTYTEVEEGETVYRLQDLYKGSRHKDHSISGKTMTDGSVTITCFSGSNSNLAGNSGILLGIKVQEDGSNNVGDKLDAKITNARFTLKSGSEDALADASFKINITDRVVLDETSIVPPAAQEGVNVLVKRTIKKGVWSTICLPMRVTKDRAKEIFGDNVKVAQISAISNEGSSYTISFTERTANNIFLENKPYLVKSENDVNEFTVDNVNIVESASPKTVLEDEDEGIVFGTFFGTLAAGTVIPKDYFFLNDNKFYYSKGTTTIKGFRGYFKLEGFESSAGAPEINFVVDGEATKIEGLNVIFDDGQYYNLKGQKVDNPTEKGVYIKNGKKVVIK